MFHFLRPKKAPQAPAPLASLPAGQRVYAVGDVHGRADLLTALIEAIEGDNRGRAEAETTVILLGDLVDRGPDSSRVLALARAWRECRNVRILCGNHEEMFLRSFESIDTLRHFLRHGGRETLLSYGVDKYDYARASIEEVQQLMADAVPQEDRDFMTGFEDLIEIGDYAFVHAGIVPGIPLKEQDATRLRWIREPFLSHAGPHERVVVHGHTITEQPEDTGNRIGIDTGAYNSGRLTALALEGTERRYITVTEQEDGNIASEVTSSSTSCQVKVPGSL